MNSLLCSSLLFEGESFVCLLCIRLDYLFKTNPYWLWQSKLSSIKWQSNVIVETFHNMRSFIIILKVHSTCFNQLLKVFVSSECIKWAENGGYPLQNLINIFVLDNSLSFSEFDSDQQKARNLFCSFVYLSLMNVKLHALLQFKQFRNSIGFHWGKNGNVWNILPDVQARI